jgi:cell division protein FtsL
MGALHQQAKSKGEESSMTRTHTPTISPQTHEATKGDRILDHAKDRGLETKFAILPDNT